MVRWLSCLVFLSLVLGCRDEASRQPIELGHLASSPEEQATLGLALEELNARPDRLPLGRPLRIRSVAGSHERPEDWGFQASRLLALNRVPAILHGGDELQTAAIDRALAGEEALEVGIHAAPGSGGSSPLFSVGLSPSARGKAVARQALAGMPDQVLIVREQGARLANLVADAFAAECRVHTGVREVDAAEPIPQECAVVLLACRLPRVKSLAAKLAGRTVLATLSETDLDDDAGLDNVHLALAYPPIGAQPESEFAAHHQEALGREPSARALLVCDALTVWAEAARRAGSLQAPAIRAELTKSDPPFETCSGQIRFHADGSSTREVCIVKFQAGRWQVIGRSPSEGSP